MELRDYESVLKAAADPTRVRILKILEGGEMCVCQVIAILSLGQSKIGRASCRGRVEISVGAVSLKKKGGRGSVRGLVSGAPGPAGPGPDPQDPRRRRDVRLPGHRDPLPRAVHRVEAPLPAPCGGAHQGPTGPEMGPLLAEPRERLPVCRTDTAEPPELAERGPRHREGP